MAGGCSTEGNWSAGDSGKWESVLDKTAHAPRVSLIVPSYNEKEDIGGTLDVVLALDYPNKEVICVDDSSDDTREVVQGYRARGVRVLRQEVPKGLNGA